MLARPILANSSAAAKDPGREDPAPQDHTEEDLTQYVNVMIGTGGHGHTYPGATVPFGAVQLSPDTYNHGWDWCSGYHQSDSSLLGFSHTHLSGTGIGDMLDVLVVPRIGAVVLDGGSRDNPGSGYRARFDHASEKAEPGYYSVLLQESRIKVELSATERTGIHRYTFPQSSEAHFLIDLAHGYAGSDSGTSRVRSSEIRIVDKTTITGSKQVDEWAKGRRIFFAMKFSRPMERTVLYDGNQAVEGQSHRAKQMKAAVLYGKTSEGEVLRVKTAISGVSVEGALKNLEAELPHWDFDGVRHQAKQAWQRQLSKIRIATPDRERKIIFYSALYHTMLAPTLFDDVDGQYRGMDGAIHQLASGSHNYSTFSLWDTYRALHPLYTLMHPDRVPDLVNCLIRMAEESPQGAPVWPLQAIETGCMTGYHSAPVIAEAIAKGFSGIDVQRAYTCLRLRALVDDYRGLAVYRKLGYVPCDQVDEAVSKTLEYAYDDWAVAAIARAAGKAGEAAMLLKRSYSYRHLFDESTGFMRPRLANGQWAEPFDPRAMGHSKRWHDFTECNGWQATFLVQYDPATYIKLFGGREKFIAKLDRLFDQSSALPPGAPPDIAGLVGQYAHGNEPSHHIAYLYTYAGAPSKTQERVRHLLDTMYRNAPDGIAGNEDCGQMSAWFVLSSLGFYAVDPVSGDYVFGSPLFDRATIELTGGRQLKLDVKRSSPEDRYINRIEWNGQSQNRSSFSHASIAQGGRFVLEMSSTPEPELSAAESKVPA